jgi:hypothetical protein
MNWKYVRTRPLPNRGTEHFHLMHGLHRYAIPISGMATFACYVRSEVFTAVSMKNAGFWDIETQFILHKRHYVSATESSQLMLCKI